MATLPRNLDSAFLAAILASEAELLDLGGFWAGFWGDFGAFSRFWPFSGRLAGFSDFWLSMSGLDFAGLF